MNVLWLVDGADPRPAPHPDNVRRGQVVVRLVDCSPEQLRAIERVLGIGGRAPRSGRDRLRPKEGG